MFKNKIIWNKKSLCYQTGESGNEIYTSKIMQRPQLLWLNMKLSWAKSRNGEEHGHQWHHYFVTIFEETKRHRERERDNPLWKGYTHRSPISCRLACNIIINSLNGIHFGTKTGTSSWYFLFLLSSDRGANTWGPSSITVLHKEYNLSASSVEMSWFCREGTQKRIGPA